MATRYLDAHTVLETIVRPMQKLNAIERHIHEVAPYLAQIPADELRGHAIAREVETVFRGADDHYEHVLIPTETSTTYLVVIVDRANNDIIGHHVLNPSDLYE